MIGAINSALRSWITPLAEALAIGGSPMGTLFGLVVGPKNILLARARVKLPALRRSAYTDPDGRFELTAVPDDTAPKTLIVKVHGPTHTVIPTGQVAAMNRSSYRSIWALPHRRA